MALSWNEIKERASRFSKEWETACNEDAEAKTFLYEFFNVFGISQRKVATFEHKVKKIDEHEGYIDLLWKGTLLIEMKSKGKNLEKALIQAKEYIDGLPQYEIPKFILLSDFEHFRLIDVEQEKSTEFVLSDLVKNVHLFDFIAGYQKRTYKEEDPVNIEAAELMGKLHDRLKVIGYTGHSLEQYLVRLLFCLFADDTGIFEKDIFQYYLENKTNDDGSDLAYHLAAIFNILNQPKESRLKNIDEDLNVFPYVNGKLFEETLPFASFDSQMRKTLLECCYLDWSKISPAIFGSLFQSVMDEKARRNLGAHYTSEKNILKLIKPLFLDNLWKEFELVKDSDKELKKLQLKISNYRFLDPACGCGNFLIIAYRELRLLEMEIVKYILKGQQVTDIGTYFLVDVDKFYGIEYEEFPAQIAQVAMWLIDHQMNMQASALFGEYFVRLPLKKSATIKHGNALQTDWQSLLNPENIINISAKHTNIYLAEEPETEYKAVNIKTGTYEIIKGHQIPVNEDIKFDFIFGNPPFGGKHLQSKEQKNDIVSLIRNVKASSDLDYVSGWFYKAAKYIQNTNTQVAFVSTNSITQGEQVSILWNELFNSFHVKINFAHQTFKWNNEARGIAAVHCIIIGFATFDTSNKKIFEYSTVNSEPYEIAVPRINAYLNSGPNVIIKKRAFSICNAPEIKYGNKPTDNGNLIFDDNEKAEFLKKEPNAVVFFKKFIGSFEFINNVSRWCLWLKDAKPNELKNLPLVLDRVEKVKVFREKSSAEPTRKAALTPSLFFYISHPNANYLVVPETSSIRRKFIPIGYVSNDVIASNAVYLIPSASLFTFGLLSSSMHMSWTRVTCGRLKSDFRYSGSIVYNNYPWPENPTEKQIALIEKVAQKVLDVRSQFPESSLADLYDPLTMPPALVKAHNELDKAVDLAYRSQPFVNETKRIEFLFELYDKYTSGLFQNKKYRRNK